MVGPRTHFSPVTLTNPEPDEVIFRSKVDIGVPGAAGGLDVGEGGSYFRDKNNATIIRAFKYDASADSGSRFTEFTDLGASNTWLGDAGDRFYVGSPHKFWAARFAVGTAKSTEVLQLRYWNGSALTNMDHMGVLKDSANSLGEDILEQTAEKEYTIWDHQIDADWAVADNQADTIPNAGVSLYWVAFQVPVGDLATAPIVTEIRVRGSDFDVITGASFPVWWGQARIVIHERISLSIVRSPGGTGTTYIDIDSAHAQTVFNFNGAGDNVSWLWVLPTGIDTSTPIKILLDYSSDAADTFNIDLSALKLVNNTAISSSVTPSYTQSTAIVAAAADTFYSKVDLTATRMSVQDLKEEDVISFEIQRTDASNAIYPFSITIHYTAWTSGEHV